MAKKNSAKAKPPRSTQQQRNNQKKASHRPRKRGKPAPTPIEADESWTELVEQYPAKRSLLESETVYALPGELLDVLQDRLPKLLSVQEWAFERELAQAAGCGFFLRQAFSYPPLLLSESEQRIDATMQDAAEASQRLREMLYADAVERGATMPQLQVDLQQAERDRQGTTQWRWAYAAWLATSAEFKRHLEIVRARASTKGAAARPPVLPLTLIGRAAPDRWSQGEVDHWLPLYQVWGLERLATWELPIPLRPELSQLTLYDYGMIGNAGVTVFVPWHLIPYRSLKLNDLIDANQRLLMPKQMNAWVNSAERAWGPSRYLTMLRLYVWLELSLKRRYFPKLNRMAGKLDRAFAGFFKEFADSESSDEQNVKLVRLQLGKRLGS